MREVTSSSGVSILRGVPAGKRPGASESGVLFKHLGDSLNSRPVNSADYHVVVALPERRSASIDHRDMNGVATSLRPNCTDTCQRSQHCRLFVRRPRPSGALP